MKARYIIALTGGIILTILALLDVGKDVVRVLTEPAGNSLFWAIFAGIAVCIIVMMGAYSTGFSLMLRGNEREKRERERRARLIIEHRGPQSFEEYLHLFPYACRRCGSRSIAIKETTYYPITDVMGLILGYGKSVSSECARCGWWSREGNPWKAVIEQYQADPEKDLVTTVRVHSPYLSTGEEDAIPDWPYSPKQQTNQHT